MCRSVNVLLLGLCLVWNVLGEEREPFQKRGDWKPIFKGIDLVDLEAEKPRLMKGHAVRLDLETKDLRFFATPDNGDQPDHTNGLKTSTFLTRYKCQLAINATAFSPIHSEEGKPQKLEGLTISDGKVVSPEVGKYPALLITKDNRVMISRPPFRLEGIHTAVSGFGMVLEKGKVLEGGKDVHPRTAAGVSRDGKTLYLLVIDGRQSKYSLGATTTEIGEWLLALGAWDGINLDGGGTTTLVIQHDKDFQVINKPIHEGKSGNERVAGSHLGVYAPTLPWPKKSPASGLPQCSRSIAD